MSRGGRGGSRGGRPKIPGFDYDPTLKLDTKPSELFPPYRVPIADAPTEKEKREVAYYLGLREKIHQGPLYTKPQMRDPTKSSRTYGEDQVNALYDNKSKADIDPFEGVPRYTWKYEQKRRAIPQLSGLPLEKSLFPPELWSTLEGEEGDAVRRTINRGIKRKSEMMLGSTETSESLSSEEKKRIMAEKIKNVVEGDDVDVDGDRDDEDAELEEEEKDYDYEDDEAEMGGDYGAEQYFDGGEGEEDDGDGGGGDEY